MEHQTLSMRSFGKLGPEITATGLGGEGILRTYGKEKAAQAVIHAALDQGIRYFDCAQAYAGSEGYYGSVWSRRPEERARVFQASKSAARSKWEALEELDDTLETMHIDHLDLWQIHDVRTENDLKMIEGPGGALEAFVEAKTSGKVRFIGVTGHHDPRILTRAVQEWPVDSVMMPINPIEAAIGGFMDVTLNAAHEKGIAVIAMKVLGASHYLSPEAGISAELLIRFALSQAVSVVIVGCSSPEHVQVLSGAAKKFTPMSEEDQRKVVSVFQPYARRLAFYRGVY